MGTCTSGGVELLDLHATVAPRRQGVQAPPTLESFNFIPYDETAMAAAGVLGPTLTDYAKTCADFVLERMRQLAAANVEDGLRNVALMRRLVSESSWAPVPAAELSRHADSPESVALRTLERVFAVEHDDAFARTVDSVVASSWAEILSRDRLFAFARCDRCLKTCLDVVLENVPPEGAGGHIKVKISMSLSIVDLYGAES